MILSNVEIINCLENNLFVIEPLDSKDPSKPPFNTSAIDLRLSNELLVPKSGSPVQLDLTSGNIAKFLSENSERKVIATDQPYSLSPNKLVLANTLEKVSFPINDGITYSARVEGKSSLARCGILIHFTAPTIHAGFYGNITLEIINLGCYNFLLKPNMFICQLIIEEVKGSPANAPNQFKGQTQPSGLN